MNEDLTEIVRRYDRPRYLASLFAPEGSRPHLSALYAFNAEIGRIAASVSEARLGEIRLQWWLDVLDQIYEGVAQSHPVAQGLARAIEAGDLPKHGLANLVRAHQFDFYSDLPVSVMDLEGQFGETSSALIQMGAMILDRDAALECSEASGLAGVAYGMAQVLAQLPRAIALKQCYLPGDMLAARGLSSSTYALPENKAALEVVLAELREKGRARLSEARKSAWTVKSSVIPAFLHVALTEPLFRQAQKRGAGLAEQGAEIMQLRMQWLIWKAARSEAF